MNLYCVTIITSCIWFVWSTGRIGLLSHISVLYSPLSPLTHISSLTHTHIPLLSHIIHLSPLSHRALSCLNFLLSLSLLSRLCLTYLLPLSSTTLLSHLYLSNLISLSLMFQLSPLSHSNLAHISAISYFSLPPLSSLTYISPISPLSSCISHCSPLSLSHALPSLTHHYPHSSITPLLSLNFSHLCRSSVFSRLYLTSRISLNMPLLSLLIHPYIFSPITTIASLTLFSLKIYNNTKYIIYYECFLILTFIHYTELD